MYLYLNTYDSIRPQVSSKPSAAAHKHWQNHPGGTGTSGKPSISQERDWTKEKVIQTRVSFRP